VALCPNPFVHPRIKFVPPDSMIVSFPLIIVFFERSFFFSKPSSIPSSWPPFSSPQYNTQPLLRPSRFSSFFSTTLISFFPPLTPRFSLPVLYDSQIAFSSSEGRIFVFPFALGQCLQTQVLSFLSDCSDMEISISTKIWVLYCLFFPLTRHIPCPMSLSFMDPPRMSSSNLTPVTVFFCKLHSIPLKEGSHANPSMSGCHLSPPRRR